MSKVENKVYINGKEVTLIAEKYPIKFYIGVEGVYVTCYDEIAATINSLDNIKFDEETKVITNEEN